MAFWNVSNPAKPVGLKDPDAVLDYPIDYSLWLADIGDTYSAHAIIVLGTLVVESSSFSSGKIIVWLSGGTINTTENFTVRITTTGGRVDDRTFYLKIRNR